jgi:hypothetical protein
MGLYGMLGGYNYFLYLDGVRTSQETHQWDSTACYEDIFIFLYVDDIRTSKDTRLWDFTACYGDSFTFLYVDNARISQETHLRPVTFVLAATHLPCPFPFLSTFAANL